MKKSNTKNIWRKRISIVVLAFLNALSIISCAGGFVSKLTTIVNIADIGTAINITSINGQGAAGKIV